MKYPLDKANFRITLKSRTDGDIMLSEEQIKDALEEAFPGCTAQVLWTDNCEVCFGSKKGVPGNENIVDGKVMCDYCSVKHIPKKEEWTVQEILEREG